MTSSTSWPDEFTAVRQLLLQSAWSSSDAVNAALHGMEQEIKRRQRDAKLKNKFVNSVNNNALNGHRMEEDAVTVDYPVVGTVEPSLARGAPIPSEPHRLTTRSSVDRPHDPTEAALASGAGADDWHTVTMEDGDSETTPSSEWAPRVIAKIASSECRSPTAALAVVLHALLLDAFGLVCTGIPDVGPSSGFAAPIRDLPPTQFLPLDWDTKDIQLRYRKDAVGSFILSVSSDAKTSMVQVSLDPVPKNSDHGTQWSFALGDYINLESWNRAALGSGGKAMAPALHYKSLASLLDTFAQTFHLTELKSSDMDATDPKSVAVHGTPYNDYTMNAYDNRTTVSVHPMAQRARRFGGDTDTDLFGTVRGPHMGYSGLVDPPMRGDFSGDLTPTGLFPHPQGVGGGVPGMPGGGGFPGMPGGGGGGSLYPPGNLMGPNHPMFRGGAHGPSFIGGGAPGMTPRFDPFGPPGGPTEPFPSDPDGLLQPRQPPGGTGNPNNDLQQPPPLGNNNLYL